MYAFLGLHLLYEVAGELLLRFLQRLIAESGGVEDALVAQGGLQLSLQVRDLALELRDDLGILRNVILHIVHVALHVCLDIFRSIRVFKRVMRIFIALARGRNVGNHNGTAVAPQGIFQKAGKLGVSERYIVLLPFAVVLMEGVDTVAKGKQGSVDVSAFDHSNASIVSL